MQISEYIERIDQVTSTAELFVLLEQAAKELGFDYAAYAALTSYNESRTKNTLNAKRYPSPFVAHNYPDSWIKHYYDHNYQDIDPVIVYSPQIMRPYLWDQMSARIKLDGHQSLLMKQAKAAGLNDGISIPIHGPEGRTFVVSFAARKKRRNPGFYLNLLHPLGVIFHDHYFKMTYSEATLEPVPCLAERELDCLMWIAEGKSSIEIGVILGIRESTVNGYIRTIYRKLNVTGRAMAVKKAGRLGLAKNLSK